MLHPVYECAFLEWQEMYINNNIVNVAESIGRPLGRTTLQMNEEDFIKKSIDIYIITIQV